MYFLLLTIAALLFSTQFLFNQNFEAECGFSLTSSALFSVYTSVFGFAVLFVLNGFKISVTPFSLMLAAVYAIVMILYNAASIKSFATVNLSAYSVFAMLGGMLLPAIYAIIFRNENITPLKLICLVMICISTLFLIDFKQKSEKRSYSYYAAVFFLNGFVGVVSVVHQSGESCVDSFSFLMLARLFSLLISLLFFYKNPKSVFAITKKSLYCSLGFAAFCSIGNLLVLISLKHLPASVQYPIITGGTMVISLVISILKKEKITPKNITAVITAFISTVLIAI